MWRLMGLALALTACEALAQTPPAARRRDAGSTECTTDRDCVRCSIDTMVTDVAACRCTGCTVTSSAHCNELVQAYETNCGPWRTTHPCPADACGPRASIQPTCVEHRCLGEPIASGNDGAPSPCHDPGDCPGGVRCVTGALGGPIGCTNETCCGTNECGNGCRNDHDCPSCRPVCRSGGCRGAHGGM